MQDISKHRQLTKNLLFENKHVLVSVSLADTLDREPEHISGKDPKELIQRFWEVLERKAVAIQTEMRRYIREEIKFPLDQQRKCISHSCFQIPVVGFISGHYDLNLSKKHFVTQVTRDSDVKVANKQENVQRQALQIALPLLYEHNVIVGQGGHCALATNASER